MEKCGNAVLVHLQKWECTSSEIEMDGDMIHIVGNDSIDLPSLAYDALFSKHSLYVDQYVSLHAAMGGNFEFLHHS